MAATVIVELTGDERRVLESYRKTEEADRKLREATGKTGDAAQAAGRDFADAWVKAGSGATAGMEKLLNQLKRTGSEGQAAAAAIDEHFRETGKAGRRSMESIIESIAGLDGEAGRIAAAAAEAIKSELAEADNQTAFNKTLSELRMIAPEAAKAAQAVRAGMSEADALTRFDNTIAALRAIDPVAADEAAKVRASLEQAAKDADFRETLEALRALGPIGQATAAAIQQDMNAAAAATQASFDDVIAKVGRIAPQAAETAERVQREFAEAARQSDFRQTIESLRKLGPEGEKLSRALQQNLEQAAAQSVGSIDGIIEKIKDIDPAAAEVAERLRLELAAADAKTNFDRSLAELRKINPEAAKAAQSVLSKMEAADNEVKFDNIIEELRKVDPVAAAEAAKMRKHLNDVPNEAGDGWEKFSSRAGTAIKSVIGAYVGAQGLSAAMQVVSGLLDDHSKKIADATSRQHDLAKAQQEAAKNLAAFTAVQRDELLQKAVPQIAREAGFMDPNKITLALGTAASKGANADEARAAVLAAARVERLTPENLEKTAAGAISVQKSTGLEDARQAIALIQTTGTQSAITDPGKTIENLSKALVGVATVPNQIREQAAIENAAIFAAITKGGNDSEGNSSATASIALTNELSSFFSDIGKTQVEIRSELERLENKKHPLEKDLLRMEELRSLIPKVEAMSDPGTLMGRLGALQQNPEVAAEFIGDGFGEVQFRQVFKDLTNATSEAAQNLNESLKLIKADAAAFEAQAAAQINLTPQLRGAALRSQAAAAIAAGQVSNIEASSLNDIRTITEQVLENTRLPGLGNFRANLAEEVGIQPNAWLANFGDTAAEESVTNLDRLFSRRRRITEDGIDPSEAPQVAALDAAIESVRRLVVDQAEYLSPESLSAAADKAGARVTTSRAQFQTDRAEFFTNIEAEFRAKSLEVAAAQLEASQRIAGAMEQQNALVAQQNGLLAETASNTRPEVPQPPNFDAAYQASLQEQDAR